MINKKSPQTKQRTDMSIGMMALIVSDSKPGPGNRFSFLFPNLKDPYGSGEQRVKDFCLTLHMVVGANIVQMDWIQDNITP